MNVEKALAILRQENGVIYSEYEKAVDVIEEALREMSAEEYRQRLMEVFHRTDHDELLTYVVMPKEEEFKSLEDILRQYKHEPKLRGEWIYHREWELDGECAFECSNCNMGVDLDFNFCPNCGADMRQKEKKCENCANCSPWDGYCGLGFNEEARDRGVCERWESA